MQYCFPYYQCLKVAPYQNLKTRTIYLFAQTIPSEIGTLSNLQQLELSQNGLSGFIPDELFEASSLSKLDLGYQAWNDWNCTRSNGDVVSAGHSKGDPENDINYGLEGEILGNQTGKLKYLKEIAVNDNYFSGEIGTCNYNPNAFTTHDTPYTMVLLFISVQANQSFLSK